jgi:hypothetical protein
LQHFLKFLIRQHFYHIQFIVTFTFIFIVSVNMWKPIFVTQILELDMWETCLKLTTTVKINALCFYLTFSSGSESRDPCVDSSRWQVDLLALKAITQSTSKIINKNAFETDAFWSVFDIWNGKAHESNFNPPTFKF